MKKKTPVWLQIYLNEENKMTFRSWRFAEEEVENDKGEKVKTVKVVRNEHAKNKYGESYVKPMNRRARRIDDRNLRLYEKKYGPKPLAPVEEKSDS